jgi:tRNA threonylcarbamoyl adenosine modification protein YeaZ
MAYGLALHTTSTQLGLALIGCTDGNANTLHTRSHDLGRDMITHLHLHVLQFLTPHTWADLCFIAVAKGPGSFTSTRIGVVMARTLGQQLNVPVFGISSLEAAAYADVLSDVLSDVPSDVLLCRDDRDRLTGDRAVGLNAARGEIFTGIYGYDQERDDIVCLQTDAAMLPQVWQKQLASRLPPPISLNVNPDHIAADTAAMATIARKRWLRGEQPAWFTLTPFYGQHPVT